eukprot:647670-Prorocentrum_minimum.AAC.1
MPGLHKLEGGAAAAGVLHTHARVDELGRVARRVLLQVSTEVGPYGESRRFTLRVTYNFTVFTL